MVAHNEDVAHAEGGCPQGATSSQDDLGQIVIGGVLGQIEFEELLALGDPDMLGSARMRERLFTVQLDLVGDDELRL